MEMCELIFEILFFVIEFLTVQCCWIKFDSSMEFYVAYA